MGTRALVLLPGIVTVMWLAACLADEPEAPGQGGEGGGGRTGLGGQGAGAEGGGRGPGGGVGLEGRTCGGRLGIPCAAHEYCDILDNGLCGARGESGVCRLRPARCTQHCEGVCGCDGQLYCNDCMANAAGVDSAAGIRVCRGVHTCRDVSDVIALRAIEGETCTSLVRLDYQTREIKSVKIACAPAEEVTPVRAREMAERVTGIGAEAQLVAGLAPSDQYVFWEPPSDRGGVSVVSARNGLVVFGGQILWNAPGEVLHPVAFNHPASIGRECGSSAPMPAARGLSLVTLDELSADDVQAALSAVWATALPDGLARGTTLLDAMVLLYPPQVGGFDPEVAEWLVMINSGTPE